jgi:integrase
MRTKRQPSYCLHRATGQAVVRIDGHDFYLGIYDTPESRSEYDRLIAEWYANGRALAPQTGNGHDRGLTVNELLVAFWQHAEQHYRRTDGSPTDEIHCLRAALRPLKELYGHTDVRDFGPLALKAVRQRMIEAVDPRTGRPWCRRSINLHTYRIRSVFRWGVENELVPSSVLHGLQAVRGLQKGRSDARETGSVKPVPEAFVTAILPFVSDAVRGMIQLQLLTGMRPGEVVILRAIDLDTSGRVWLYMPGSDQGEHGTHKTAWHGHGRVIAIGPQAQEVLKPFLKPNLYAYLFSPRECMESLWEKRRRERTTKVQPSRAAPKRKPRPRRKPGDRYTVDSYRMAIARACDQAFPPPEHLGPRILADGKLETRRQFKGRLTEAEKAELREWRQAHRWHPHQLRHTKATEIRKEAGLDAARAVLGHRSPQITEVYAELDIGKASEVMERFG